MLRWQLVSLLILLVSSVCIGSAFAQDAYEEDNTFSDATVIVIHDQDPQQHDLHTASDQDWIMFYALESTNYQVEVSNVGPGIDPYIELYDTNGTSVLLSSDMNGPGGDETLLWHCPQDKEGIYFVKIGHVETSSYGSETGYLLELIYPGLFTLPGYLTGTIQNGSAHPVAGARIRVINNETGAQGSGITLPNGSFIVCLEGGNCSMTVQANGYDSRTVSASVPGSVNVTLNTWPVARADQVETTRGGSVSGNVLDNDYDGDGDNLSAVLDSGVSHGILSLDSDGSFSYTHDTGNDILDSFTYHATDGRANSARTTVTIFIQKTHLPFLMLLLNGTP